MLTEEGRRLVAAKRKIQEVLDRHYAMLEPIMQKLHDAGLAPLEDYDPEPELQPDLEKRIHPDTKQRRAKVRDLWVAGLTDAQIARLVSASKSTVKRDLRAMGLRRKR